MDSRGTDGRHSEHTGDRFNERSLSKHAPTLPGGPEGGNPVMQRFWSWLAVEHTGHGAEAAAAAETGG